MSDETLRLLLVEDDPDLRMQLRRALTGFDVHVAEDRASALAVVHRERPAVVVMDLGLAPDRGGAAEGLAILEAILTARPRTRVIVASDGGDRHNALKAVGLGACDVHAKPPDGLVLRLIVERTWRHHLLEEEVRLMNQPSHGSSLNGVIAASPVMQKVCRTIERIAASGVGSGSGSGVGSGVGVLITGESGTGKELLARAVHDLSPRAAAPFVAINCAAIPETLLESELFGHEKGSFTGAVRQTIGRIEQAEGGTLFLDEVGDMALPLQAKLLRFLQGRTIERVGGRRSIEVDVRVVSATNRDLTAMMRGGSFREDLYYRLNEVGVHIPPLRERPGDAVLIANHLLNKVRNGADGSLKGFTSDALAAIAAHPWPGNVRELENRVKRAAVLAEAKLITAADLDLASPPGSAPLPTLRQAREQAELDVITRALAMAGNNISEAARLLGVSRPTLYDAMKTLDLNWRS
ncbi:MAG: PEP-CTERM-box response regulator transcription factor [Alphaproteobacteria bacterium]